MPLRRVKSPRRSEFRPDDGLSARAVAALKGLARHEREIFAMRLGRSREDLLGPLARLYGHLPEYAAFAEDLVGVLAEGWAERLAELRRLDLQRDLEPDWFLHERMVGYVLYIDRFAGTIPDVVDRLDYLEELGVTYLHFMPCLRPRPGDSDGGYSVMDYRAVDPRFGTMDDLEAAARALRMRGMSLCVDLVLNHTAKEHEWAAKARAGDPAYQAFYWMFDNRTLPDRYETTLTEVFPAHAPGNFTWYPDFGKWVWTTFNEHQWDLNWANPRVFLEIVALMLFLANKGVEVFRLDAVAFLWKRMGTRCQNEPEVHDVLQALRAASRIAAPAVIHKEEAIVSPRDLVPYLGAGSHAGREGNLAYHNSLMVQFWSALAARDTRLMTYVLRTHFPTGFRNATWATYLRCHDDIGWAVTDEDAAALGISGPAHRAFLADFYEGAFPGSFARGAPFQSNPQTGDRRSSGTTASLCGLEKALAENDLAGIESAIHRILMGHALIASFGGIPLLYMGDEIGLLNDRTYLADPDKAHDSRWMHRPAMDWAKAQRRLIAGTLEARIQSGIVEIMRRRKTTPHLRADNPTEILDGAAEGVFVFRRASPLGALLAFFNFTEAWRAVPQGFAGSNGARDFVDRLTGHSVVPEDGMILLPPYARLWLT
ncbi:MAG TPA: alpha-amylase family protein [Bauldia sp.]|nr:alpha-amylase family protein [Bauldia sp.]